MIVRFLLALSLIITGFFIGNYLAIPAMQPLNILDNSKNLKRQPQPNTQNKKVVLATMQVAAQYSQSSALSIEQIRRLPTEFMQYHESYHLALISSESRLQLLINESLSLVHQNERYGLASIFFNRYVTLNPNNALLFFHSLFSIQDKEITLLYGMYHEWAWMDMQSALDHINTIESTPLREDIIMYLTRTPNFPDVQQLNLVAQSLSEDTKNTVLWRQAFQNGPKSAFMQFLALPKNDPKRSTWLSTAIRRWSRLDPQAAYSQVLKIEEQNLQRSLASTILQHWITKEPETALLAAIDLDGNNGNLSSNALGQLATVDPQKAIALTNKYSEQLPNKALEEVFTRWAYTAPKETAEYILLNQLDISNRVIQNVAISYVKNTPTEAYLWATEIGLSNQVLGYMDHTLANTNPDTAEQQLISLEPGGRKDSLLSSIAGRKSQEYPQQALSWLENYRTEAGFNQAKDNIYNHWTYNAPLQAAKNIEQNHKNKKYINQLVNNWYQQKPHQVEQWALGLNDTDMRDTALSHLIENMMTNDREQATLLAMQLTDENKQQQWLDRLDKLAVNSRANIK